MRQSGVSLLELIIAIVFVVSILTMMALFIPRASQSAFENRQRWQASEIARAQIESWKGTTYSLIPVTAADPLVFSDTSANGCNCQDAVYDPPSPSLSSTTVIGSNISYGVQSCINFVDLTGGVWQSKCPAAGFDTNTKSVHVRIAWKNNVTTLYTESEILINR